MTIERESEYESVAGGSFGGAFARIVRLLSSFGRATVILCAALGSFPAAFGRRNSRDAFFRELYAAGIGILPVVTTISLFVGMILALQVGLELRRFNQEIYLGAAVMVSLLREFGPFSCGVCLAACAGSAIAAELGTMKVGEEIAALEIMAIPPIRFLASPRIVALAVIAPILGFYCSVIGLVGGGIVGSMQLGVDFSQYMTSALSIATVKDLYVGLFKALWCGLVVGTVAVFEGFSADGGATGVGRATQRSVIVNFLLILMFGYIITRICYR